MAAKSTKAKEARLKVAHAIADQIGEGAFLMMGTTDQYGDENSLYFNIKRCKKYNWIRIVLQSDDTYIVEFIKIGRAPKHNRTTKQEAGVHVEDLHGVIERETGLYLTIPLVRFLAP